MVQQDCVNVPRNGGTGATGGSMDDGTDVETAAGRGYEPVYAIFEGGGAKGVSHVGALKAMEEDDLALVGVAGTSAGAIMAALTAVGYKADEVFAPDGSNDILSSIGVGPLDLVGRWRWRWYRLARRVLLPLTKLGAVLTFAVLALAAASITLGHPGPAAFFGPTIAAAVAIIASVIALVAPAVRRRGLFDTHALQTALNELLRRKVAAHRELLGLDGDAPARVRFRDIDPTVLPLCCRLKVIVSDVRSGRLAVFDHTTPDVVIAEAVAASAAIPIAFVPPRIPSGIDDGSPVYADGGLVSNLPTWAFRHEKAALQRELGGPPITVIACTLVEPSPAKGAAARAMGIKDYLQAVFSTAMSGSQHVAKSLVDDLHQIEIPSPLATLAFDCTAEQAKGAYLVGRSAARASLARRRKGASLTERLLSDALAKLTTEVGDRRTAEGRPVPALRLSLVDPVRAPGQPITSFRVVAIATRSDDADDRLELDVSHPHAPQAYFERAALLGTFESQGPSSMRMTKYEMALLPEGLVSVICLPVWARPPKAGLALPEPQRVLRLDSTDSLHTEFADVKFMSELARASLLTSRTLIEERTA